MSTIDDDIDTSESDAYAAYMNGSMPAADVVKGYQDGTIKIPQVEPEEDAPGWYSDDWMNTRINPWTYTPDKDDSEVQAIRAARDAAPDPTPGG